MQKELFLNLNEEELMQVDGGGLFEDIGYGIGYTARGAYEGVKTVGNAVKEFIDPKNYINYFYPGLLPK